MTDLKSEKNKSHPITSVPASIAEIRSSNMDKALQQFKNKIMQLKLISEVDLQYTNYANGLIYFNLNLITDDIGDNVQLTCNPATDFKISDNGYTAFTFAIYASDIKSDKKTYNNIAKIFDTQRKQLKLNAVRIDIDQSDSNIVQTCKIDDLGSLLLLLKSEYDWLGEKIMAGKDID